jgi:hypothetical protein
MLTSCCSSRKEHTLLEEERLAWHEWSGAWEAQRLKIDWEVER